MAARDDDLPPLDECLSAMDERIEFLSSALSSLSEELSAKSKPGAGGASPVAAELARVKAQLKEAEARAASSRQAAPPSGASDLARVEAELSALKSENAALKAAAAAAPAAAGAGGDVAELKAKLEAAERENAALKDQLKQKDQEIDDLNTAARVAASCVTASGPFPLAAGRTTALFAAALHSASCAAFAPPSANLGSEISAHSASPTRSMAPVAPLAMDGLDTVPEGPKVVTPTAVKKARGGAKPKPRRRMSLASSFKAEGEDKLGRIERMVDLLTNIPAARDLEGLVAAIINGTFTLLAPHVSSVSLWLAPQNKTYTAISATGVDTSEELGSMFMKRQYDDPAAKVNIGRAEYMMHLGKAAKEDDMPEAVMCLPILSAQRRGQLTAILELRNARPPVLGTQGDFGPEEEELLAAVTNQSAVSLDNVLYNNKMSQALQQFSYSQFDTEKLKQEIVENGKKLFEAEKFLLARHNAADKTIEMTFSGGQTKVIPDGGGSTWMVLSTRLPLSLNKLSSGNASALRAEYEFADDEDPAMLLSPVIGEGEIKGMLGVFGASTDTGESEELLRLFSTQAATLLKNSATYATAMTQNEKVKNKLELLDVSKAFASELDQHTLIVTIIERTREVLDADRCALFMVDEQREQLWATLHDGTIIRTGIHEGICGWVATNDEPLTINDAYADARFNTDVDRETGYRTNSILAVPVHNADGTLTGVIQMINKRGGPFSDDDREMLQTIASQAGVTLNNAQLFDRLTVGQQNFNVLMDISKKLSSELNIRNLIQSIMTSARELLNCDRATLFMADYSTNELYSYVADGVNTFRFPMSAGIAGSVATTNEIINIKDAYEDHRFNQQFDKSSGYRTTSILCVPVNSSKGKLLGVCQMINKGGGGEPGNPVTPGSCFDDADESLVGALMSQAAVSIENAQLFEKALAQKHSMESVLASVGNLIIAFDKNGCMKMCNHSSWLEKYFNITEENIGTRLKYNKWLSDYPQVVAEIKNTLEKRTTYESAAPIDVVNEETREEFSLKFSINTMEQPEQDGDEAGIGGDQEEGGCVVVFEDLSEKKQMQSALGRYLSGPLVDQVLGSGADVLGGVRQKVTILFSDIRSFTTISEGMDPVDLVAMLNDYFTYELPLIFDNGGILDKFIGDAIMACFGVPFVSDPGTEQAGKMDACMSCKTSLEQLGALEIFNAARKKKFGAETETFAIGIGLNTNNVVSGNIGSAQRMEYTVIGDGVNLASRLEGITKTVRPRPPSPVYCCWRACVCGLLTHPGLVRSTGSRCACLSSQTRRWRATSSRARSTRSPSRARPPA